MLNKVMLIGRLGADPDLRYTQSGQAVCSMRVATDESYTDKDGNRVERTEWHSVVVFGKSAEHCNQFLGKGSLAYVEGKLATRKWKDQEGKVRYTTEIRADRVQFLDRKEGGGQKPAQRKERGYRTTNEDCPDLGPACPSELANMDDIPF